MQPNSYYSNPRSDVLSLLRRRAALKVLEIGGGDFPTLIEACSQVGGEAWGVDVRPSTTRLDRMLIGSVTSDAVRSELSNVRFDVIIANDVLEHVEDSEGFFSVLSELLSADGEVLLSVPNIRNVKLLYHVFLRGRFPREEAGLFDKTHLRWFCRKDIEALSKNVGLRVDHHRYSGRLAGNGLLSHFRPVELVALQNLFRLVRD